MRRKRSAKGESCEGNWQFSPSNLADQPVRSVLNYSSTTILIGYFSLSTILTSSLLHWRPGFPRTDQQGKVWCWFNPARHFWLPPFDGKCSVERRAATVWDNIITNIMWATSTTQHLWEKKRHSLQSHIELFDWGKYCFYTFLDKFVASLDPMIIISQQKSDGGDGSGCLYLDW